MIVFEGPRDISPFPSGLGVARPRSEPRLLCFLGVFCMLPCIHAALILLGEDRQAAERRKLAPFTGP